MRLSKVDLPAFGAPTRATKPHFEVISFQLSAIGAPV
jgi:hypothetical protein